MNAIELSETKIMPYESLGQVCGACLMHGIKVTNPEKSEFIVRSTRQTMPIGTSYVEFMEVATGLIYSIPLNVTPLMRLAFSDGTPFGLKEKI